MAAVKFSFIIASMVFFIIYIVLRENRQRRVASIFELISLAFLVAFTSQYVTNYNFFSRSAYTFANITMVLLFIFSVVILIYRLICFIRRK